MSVSRRVFVSARFADAALAAQVASQLRRSGQQVSSGWHDTNDLRRDEDLDRNERAALCERGMRCMRQANALLLLWHEDCRGSLVEAADAASAGYMVVIVGDWRRVTPTLSKPGVVFVETVDDAIKVLSSERRAA